MSVKHGQVLAMKEKNPENVGSIKMLIRLANVVLLAVKHGQVSAMKEKATRCS